MVLTLHLLINKGVTMITQMHTCAQTRQTHKGNTIRPNTTYDIFVH